MEWRQIPSHQRQNAKKQAEQIRFCLVQAREYFESAEMTSSATKPVLLYYGIMSLALAEILIKQDGNSSLDKMRMQNAHHGLEMKAIGRFTSEAKLKDSASRLLSKPAIKINQDRFGTFELWHATAREAPIVGYVDTIDGKVKRSSPEILLFPLPRRMGHLPASGLTFLEVICRMPGMFFQMGDFGVVPRLVRATFRGQRRGQRPIECQFMVHPGEEDAIVRTLSACQFAPEAAVLMDVEIFRS